MSLERIKIIKALPTFTIFFEDIMSLYANRCKHLMDLINFVNVFKKS